VVDTKTPYVLPETSAFELGKYKLSVWVKKAETTGSITTALGSYDSFYIANVNCVTKDPANRVYANGDAKFDITSLKFTFNTIQGIGGITGPYSYRLHIYNPTTNTWIKRVTEYKQAPSYTFEKAGTYMVVVHVNTVKSTTWPNYIKEAKTFANQGSTYGTYEAWKTIMVTVKEEETEKLVEGTVKDAIFGSLVNVNMTTEGIFKYATATNYQLFNGTSASSASTALGTATTVFPRKFTGDKVTVKLIDVSGAVIFTTEIALASTQ
jgi:hypothetical protein